MYMQTLNVCSGQVSAVWSFIWGPSACQVFLRGEFMRIAAASMPLTIPYGVALRLYHKALK
jgi:hypothetical protein